MRWLKTLLAITLVSGAACSDTLAPDVQPASAARDFFTSWPAIDTAWATWTTTKQPSEPGPIRLAPWAPPLTTYDTTFLAVQGRPSSHAIYFQQQPWQLYPVKYMELEIPPGAEFVDENGNTVPRGTVVPITVHADSGVIRFEFGPHGSRFSTRKPALLRVWWLYADLGSLSAAGLQVWYQADSTDAWNSLSTEVDMVGMYLEAPIYHFSNYAVAW